MCAPTRARRRGPAARRGSHRGGRDDASPRPRRRRGRRSRLDGGDRRLSHRGQDRPAHAGPSVRRAQPRRRARSGPGAPRRDERGRGFGLASVDTILSTSLQARQLVEAIRAGDRARTVRAAVLYYGSHLASRGGPVSAHERDVHALIEVSSRKAAPAPRSSRFSRGTYGVGLYMRAPLARGPWRSSSTRPTPIPPSHQAGMRGAGGHVRRPLLLASLG